MGELMHTGAVLMGELMHTGAVLMGELMRRGGVRTLCGRVRAVLEQPWSSARAESRPSSICLSDMFRNDFQHSWQECLRESSRAASHSLEKGGQVLVKFW